jgi:uncharacterized protein (TIGR03435 family)
MIRAITLTVVVLCGVAVFAGQDATLRWEAVSIKPVSELPPPGSGARGANLLNLPYTTLQNLVVFAYETPVYRVVGGPAWVTTARYAMLGKTDAPAPPTRMRPLVQQLLADRFTLKFHRERREIAAYELVFARRDRRLGSKLTTATIDCTPFVSGERPVSESPMIDRGGRMVSRCATAMSANLTNGLITPQLNGVTIERFAKYLEGVTKRPVQDRTGLSGVFDIELTYVDENMQQFPGLERKAPPEGFFLTTALTEQLGLNWIQRGPQSKC